MLTSSEYINYDALGLAELVATDQVTPTELLDIALSACENLNPDINAVIRVMETEARETISRGVPRGSFSGVPYLLKDLTAMYAGVPTTNGSKFFKDNVPDYDTVTVDRLKKSGLIIFGKTNTPELGGNVSTEPQLFGPTRNPWDIAISSGGSSGGSAAAVAARIVPAAHATDGGGSIRIPASCCGLFGLKPSRGRTSFGPILGEAWNGMTSEHAITRTVRDSAALLDVISGYEIGDPYTCFPQDGTFLGALNQPPRKLRIAWTGISPSGAPVAKEVLNCLANTVKLLESMGHTCVEASPPYDGPALSDANVKVIAVHHANNIAKRAGKIGREPEENEIEKVMANRIGIGKSVTGVEYVRAVEMFHSSARILGQFMLEFDIILRPTVAKLPQPIGTFDMNTADLKSFLSELWGFIPFTALFNATGQPAMSVPLGWSNNLPIGMQFAGRFGDEVTLLQLARQLEIEVPWANKIPKIVSDLSV